MTHTRPGRHGAGNAAHYWGEKAGLYKKLAPDGPQAGPQGQVWENCGDGPLGGRMPTGTPGEPQGVPGN